MVNQEFLIFNQLFLGITLHFKVMALVFIIGSRELSQDRQHFVHIVPCFQSVRYAANPEGKWSLLRDRQSKQSKDV
jgi:hypothetical protein